MFPENIMDISPILMFIITCAIAWKFRSWEVKTKELKTRLL